MKHNKKRNTAFIYETLARELTKSIIHKDDDKKVKIVSIIKEFFNKHSILGKELEFYKILLETRKVQEKYAERLLQETKTAYAKLDDKKIFDAQSKTIASINKMLGQEIWSNFVPNFKSYASVNAIFGINLPVKTRVLFEQFIIDEMTDKATLTESANLEPIDNLTYHSFTKKYNEKYSNLLKEQKELLNFYITSFADGGLELKVYLNEELTRLKNGLADIQDKETERVTKQKISEVLNYLEEFRKREFTEKDLNKVLKTQELVRELL
jgi:hypothetical protein